MNSFFMAKQPILDSNLNMYGYERILLEGAPRGLPPMEVVIEILENISESQQLQDEIIQYKQEGYKSDISGPAHPTKLYQLAQSLKGGYLDSDSYSYEIVQFVTHMEIGKLKPLNEFCANNNVFPQTIFEVSGRAHAWTELICTELSKCEH